MEDNLCEMKKKYEIFPLKFYLKVESLKIHARKFFGLT